MAHGKRFKAFLWLYTVALLIHLITMDWSASAVVAISVGLIAATIAHMRHGFWTLGLLIIHLSLEWSQHTMHGWHYSNTEIFMAGIHVLLDFAFIWQEVEAHIPKYSKLVFWSIILAILVGALIFYSPEPVAIAHSHGSNILENIVIGGILGCTLSHLFSHRRSREAI